MVDGFPAGRDTVITYHAHRAVLGYAPFAVWYPYTLYRDSHLLHHNDEDLTLPGIDPESQQSNQACATAQ